ncbi:MAG: hypothetical protein DLM58_10740 [Pseudonocardiales bacterium]|nr:MAG: hypothetical protein DLM58_10740 [Pseudonocardiales bacterium]
MTAVAADIGSRAPIVTSRRTIGLVTVTTILVGLANYGMSLVVVRYLPAREFSEFAAGQGLLLVLGTGSLAALPWAVARYLASPQYDSSRAKAMSFALIGSALQAVVLGSIALLTCWFLGGPAFAIVCGAGTALISMLAGPTGFLQGENQLAGIAATRSLETALRIGVSLALIFLVAHSAVLALVGFPVGTAAALGYALWRGRHAFPLHRLERSTAVALSRQAVLLGAIQVLLAMLAALDTVYAEAGRFGPDAAASYQSAALLGRIPLFFSSALSIAVYTSLVAARGEAAAGKLLRSSLRTYAWLTLPFVVACSTLPGALLYDFVPSSYSQTLSVLKISCLAGTLVGAINVLTTAHQARGRFHACITVLTAGVVFQAIALIAGGRSGSVIAFALAALAVAAATSLLLAMDASIWLVRPSVTSLRRVWPVVPLSAIAFLPLPPGAWLAAVTGLSLTCLYCAFKQ